MPKGVPNKRYTPEFKRMVIETMRNEHLSCRETARRFEINDHTRIIDWERIYLEEGPEGFAIERRGRASAATGTQKGRPTQFPPKAEEDLLAELQRLRAENAYLKNLQALVLEDERRQNKKHW
jgi:transposase-like protein